MKSKYKIIFGFVIVIVLAIVYFFLLNSDKSPDEPQEDSSDEEFVKIIDAEKEKVLSIVLKVNDSVTEIVPKEGKTGEWVIKGFENISLDQNNVDAFVESMISISAREVQNAEKDTTQYGFDNKNKSITIKFEDGTEKAVYIGSATPDNNYYYAETDNGAIYIIDSINGKRVAYTINDFADKTIPQVSPYKLLKLNIKRKDKPEIDLEYTPNKEGNAQNLLEMGMETMKMNKPYYGRAVYPSNLQESVLSNITDFQLGDIAQASLENSQKFGLDAPDVQISMSDDSNSFNINVGKKADDTNYYCTVNDKKAVFLVDEKYINPFINADPIKFIEKFVALYYRADLQKAEISVKGKNYTITFGEESENTEQNTSENQSNKFNDNRKTYLNGKEIDKDTFADFFELLTGITFDSVDENAKPKGETEVVVKYFLKDGSIREVKFIGFNDSFFVADVGEDLKGMLVSRQNVMRVFDKAEEILNNE